MCRLSPVIMGRLCIAVVSLVVEPSLPDQGLNSVLCFSRQRILTHWTTREVLQLTPHLKSLHCTQALRGTPPRATLQPKTPPHHRVTETPPPPLPAEKLPSSFKATPSSLGTEPSCLKCFDKKPEQCSSLLKACTAGPALLGSGVTCSVQQRLRVEQGTWHSNGEISGAVGRCSHLETHNLQTDVSPRTEHKFSGHRGRSQTHSLPSPLLRNDARCVPPRKAIS